MTRERTGAWKRLKAVSLFTLGGVILALVLHALDTSYADLAERADWSLGYALLALLTACFGNLVTAFRWKLLVEAGGQQRLRFWDYFRVTMLTRLLGQFSSNLVMDLVGRSTAMRWHGDQRSLGKRLSTVIVERGLDIAQLCLMAPWLFILDGDGRRFAPWLFGLASIGVLVLAGPLLHFAARSLVFARSLYARVRGLAVPEEVHLELGPQVVRQVAYLSIVRHWLVTLQFWTMGATVGVVLPAFFIAAATPIAQLSTLIGITPGSLGFQEVGWAGALSLLGLDPTTTALFVLGQRFLLIALFAVLALIAEILYRIQAK